MTEQADFIDELEERQEDEFTSKALESAEQKVVTARRERDTARNALKKESARAEKLEEELSALVSIHELNPEPPKWQVPEKPKAGNHAIITTLLSDMHFDEIVDPIEMNGVNAYDREIATLRLKKYFEKTVSLARDYASGITIDGAVLMLGGDTVTGEIHDELARTNEDDLPGTILYWTEQIAAGIDMMADEVKKISVYSVPGNHGRMDKRSPMKRRSGRSWDQHVAGVLAMLFKGDKRVTFTVPAAFDVQFNIYNTNYLLHHGDAYRGGGGIGGIWPPIMRGEAKRRNAHSMTGRPYDIAAMGHWHQLTWGPGNAFVINGSLKGYDEYALVSGFGYEPAQQAWWLTTPEHGVFFQTGIQVEDRKAEGW